MYHLKATLATARRVLQQLSHDKRSIALIFGAPLMLMSLLWWLYSGDDKIFDRVGPALLAIFPFVIMFLITSIATLRERRSGTLEQVLITPIGKLDFITGYAVSFGLLAILQAVVVSGFCFWALGMETAGPQWFVVLVALANSLLGSTTGLMVSAFARTEFQAVQFMPLIVLPQLLVCGLLLPIEAMPDLLQTIAWYLPLTYAVDAIHYAVEHADLASDAWRSLTVVFGFVVATIVLGSLTLRRRSK